MTANLTPQSTETCAPHRHQAKASLSDISLPNRPLYFGYHGRIGAVAAIAASFMTVPTIAQNAGVDQAKIRTSDQQLSEARNRERVVLQVQALGDGQVGPAVGVESSKPELRGAPIYQVLGVGATPDRMVKGAEVLAHSTGRPVIPINNASTKQRLAEELERAGRSAPGSMTDRLDQARIEVFGRLGDAVRTVHDRELPAHSAVEPSTKTVALLAHEVVALDKPFILVAHSQGSVIAQNAMIIFVGQLNHEVEQKIITASDLNERLSRITVFAVGAYAEAEDWPSSITVVHLNNKDDVVSTLGGHNELLQREGQDFTLKSHSYEERYVPMIARELERLANGEKKDGSDSK